MKKDILSIEDLSKEEILALIDRALRIKGEGRYVSDSLAGFTLGLIFDFDFMRTL